MMRFVQRLDYSKFPEIDESMSKIGPNAYFELSRPQLVADWGYPFYSTVVEGIQQEKIIGLNSDFWAAFMGGDKRLGHDLVFFIPESRFYFFDLVVGCYVPTSEEKVRLGLYVHEFVHTAQYERYGSIQAFLVDYLKECIDPGYGNGPLEKQADRRAKKIVRAG